MTNMPGNEDGQENLRHAMPQVLVNLYDGLNEKGIKVYCEAVGDIPTIRLRGLGEDELGVLNATIAELEQAGKLEGYDQVFFFKGVDLDEGNNIIPGKEQISFWMKTTPSQ